MKKSAAAMEQRLKECALDIHKQIDFYRKDYVEKIEGDLSGGDFGRDYDINNAYIKNCLYKKCGNPIKHIVVCDERT